MKKGGEYFSRRNEDVTRREQCEFLLEGKREKVLELQIRKGGGVEWITLRGVRRGKRGRPILPLRGGKEGGRMAQLIDWEVGSKHSRRAHRLNWVQDHFFFLGKGGSAMRGPLVKSEEK